MSDPALFLRGSADDDLEKLTCCARQLAKEYGIETIVVGDECQWLLAHGNEKRILPASDLAKFREVAHPEKFYKLCNRIGRTSIRSFFDKEERVSWLATVTA